MKFLKIENLDSSVSKELPTVFFLSIDQVEYLVQCSDLSDGFEVHLKKGHQLPGLTDQLIARIRPTQQGVLFASNVIKGDGKYSY